MVRARSKKERPAPTNGARWVLFMPSIPAKPASVRVKIWRRLRRDRRHEQHPARPVGRCRSLLLAARAHHRAPSYGLREWDAQKPASRRARARVSVHEIFVTLRLRTFVRATVAAMNRRESIGTIAGAVVATVAASRVSLA